MRLTSFAKIASNPVRSAKREMSLITVHSGLKPKPILPQSQLLIIGKRKWLKQITYSELAPKLVGISSELYEKAIRLLENGVVNVPLYLIYAQVIGIADESSRHNSPSNAHSIAKSMKCMLPFLTSSASIVLVCKYSELFASVAAIGRCFPLYNRKTKANACKYVSIEIVLAEKEKELVLDDVNLLQSLVNSIRFSQRIVDSPCPEMNTNMFVEEAMRVADNLPDVDTMVIKGKDLLLKGFGGIYNVGKAAEHPPAFVRLSYTPEKATETYALVGKGIVYDTGGTQIKMKTAMPGMKKDLGGAAAVLAAFDALVRNGFEQNLHCLLCIAENMIAPNANKPDDVITMLSGKTVEISNTDAEGRLVLADGVFYAQNELKANVIIDMATLTGAQSFATGQKHAAVMTNRESWERQIVEAGQYSGDLCHPLPYCPDLFISDLNSTVADMKNANLGKTQGPPSCIAGLFIGAHLNLTEEITWIHIDMAAPAEHAERATGYGPALLLCLLGSKQSDSNYELLKVL